MKTVQSKICDQYALKVDFDIKLFEKKVGTFVLRRKIGCCKSDNFHCKLLFVSNHIIDKNENHLFDSLVNSIFDVFINFVRLKKS